MDFIFLFVCFIDPTPWPWNAFFLFTVSRRCIQQGENGEEGNIYIERDSEREKRETH